ncbi:MAG: histidine phosphatase family protein [Armatimonadetes bacterium]|nr:histidine phosphatase family protein [Armatimonadota bacterium]
MDNLLSCSLPYVCLLRHGETEYSIARRYNGRTDVGLTRNGEEAARQLGPILARVRWEIILCSNMKRARRTAELAGFHAPEIVEALHECDYGDYEGKTTEEILALQPCPGGEGPENVAARLRPVVRRLLGSRGPVLVFSHSHAIRILSALLLGLDPKQGSIFSLEAGRLNVIRIHRGTPEIALWNDGGHIPEGS